MQLFDVYPIQPIALAKGIGSKLWDDAGNEYLDLYGGHAVISIGHSHPKYVQAICEQVEKLGYYSNSVINPLQKLLANRLGEMSGYNEYKLFLCNAGAEAVENALKLASFHTGKKGVISFEKGFHGRTSLAIGVTDNSKIQAPINLNHHVSILPFYDLNEVENILKMGESCAVIIEGIQGIAGIYEPSAEFILGLRKLCNEHGAMLVIDEIQSGYGRTGKFFAHQYSAVKADIITVAKGMGNGFPVGGVLINPAIKAWPGMLGTTFGGNQLACAAAIAVLDVIEEEDLMTNALSIGNYLLSELNKFDGIEVRGRGLMIAIEFDCVVKETRARLLSNHRVFTGVATNPKVLRILPALCITKTEADYFLTALKETIQTIEA